MPIHIHCTACQQPLSVADDYEGTQVTCPQCGVVMPVQKATETAAADLGATRWSVRIPEGKVYGPIERDELDRWIDEGRVDGNCMLLAEGEAIWKQAALVYPHLELRPRPPAFGLGPTSGSIGGESTAYVEPHRGGMLLAFGILGIAVCAVFSPVAWWMSRTDMKAIREGRMDRRGEGLTQAGLILGIIGTVLFVIGLLFMLAYFAFIIFLISQAPGGPFGGGGPGGPVGPGGF